jgi:hypothetical protein
VVGSATRAGTGDPGIQRFPFGDHDDYRPIELSRLPASLTWAPSTKAELRCDQRLDRDRRYHRDDL